jgi:hypothetical protein
MYWDEMNYEIGRLCQKCDKIIIDFKTSFSEIAFKMSENQSI